MDLLRFFSAKVAITNSKGVAIAFFLFSSFLWSFSAVKKPAFWRLFTQMTGFQKTG